MGRGSEAEVYFTADTHFGHANIIRYCHRPYRDVAEMDAAMIAAWNAKVPAEAIIYHLGDFTLAGRTAAAGYFAQLHGQIRVLPGSHDERWLPKKLGPDTELRSLDGVPVEIMPPLLSLEFPSLSSDGQHPQVIVLCHYALRVWDRSHYGAWHLYGHSHGDLPPLGRSLDVGVDVRAAPLRLDEVAALLREPREEAK
jgi:calcineurin-like phosphoesterase family protein